MKIEKNLKMTQKDANKYIYTITMVKDLGKVRCIGYYFDLDFTIMVVLYDPMIWEEDYYKYAVIECVPEGTYPVKLNNQIWIDNNGDIIDPPDQFKNTICIGVG